MSGSTWIAAATTAANAPMTAIRMAMPFFPEPASWLPPSPPSPLAPPPPLPGVCPFWAAPPPDPAPVCDMVLPVSEDH
ncbi:hypothetical protein CVT30_30435 [Streptomyces sp. AMCC400023]|nr:hypothetical protein CVT30_30435 [Streptomyces sp. AMCC400023]